MELICLVLFEFTGLLQNNFTCLKGEKKNDLQQKTEMNNYGAAGRIINEENINGITCGNEDQDLVLIRQ